MIGLKRNIRGLILAEALLAVAVLVTATIILGTIINNAVLATKTSKNYLLAQNLSNEAIAVMKSLRETNHLLRPPESEEQGVQQCWLYLDPAFLAADPDADCDVVASEGEHYVFVNSNGMWRLDAVQSNQRDTFQLSLNDGVYGYSNDPEAVETNFYRRIHVTEVPADKQSVKFDVIVEWQDGPQLRNLTRSFTLFNNIF